MQTVNETQIFPHSPDIHRAPPRIRQRPSSAFQGRHRKVHLLHACRKDTYFDQIDRLATSLAERLERFRAPDEPKAQTLAALTPTDTPTPAVLLGETSPDLLEARVSLIRYLDQMGVRVLPQKHYSRIPDKHQAAFEADLAGSVLFVQLLGPYPWVRTDELPDGYEGMQPSRALSCGKPVLRWRSREVNPPAVSDPLHREQLKAPDVAAMDLEEFKRAVADEIRRRTAPKPRTSATDGNQFVLMSASQQDMAVADEIAARLYAAGIGYDLVDERTPLDQLAQSDDYDGLMVVYGSCQQEWVAGQVRLCRRIMLQRKSDRLRCAVYVGPPEPKEVLRCRPPKFRFIEWHDRQGWDELLAWARAEEAGV